MIQVSFKQWNADQLIARIPRILTEYGKVVTPILQESIKSKAYDYPVPTVRKVGLFSGKQVPSGLRDIVDTGQLLNSQTAPMVSDKELLISWTAPYSKQVLEGGYLVGTVRNAYMAPARNWITPVLKFKRPERFFAEEWRKLSQ